MWTYPKYGLARIAVPTIITMLIIMMTITYIMVINSPKSDLVAGVMFIMGFMGTISILIINNLSKKHIIEMEEKINKIIENEKSLYSRIKGL